MMIISKMNPDDIEQVAGIEKDTFSVPWSKKAFDDTLELKNVIFLVAKENEKVLGYCGVYIALDEGEITNVAVAQSFQNRGIAGRLLQELKMQAMKYGVKNCYLEVRKSNQAAIHLYQKNGFEVKGVRKRFYEKPIEDAYIMAAEYCNSEKDI